MAQLARLIGRCKRHTGAVRPECACIVSFSGTTDIRGLSSVPAGTELTSAGKEQLDGS